MDFFEAQDEARQRTLLLVGLFVLAVLALIGLTNLLVMGAIMWSNRATDPFVRQLAPAFDWHLFVAVSAGVIAIVAAGTLYKLSVLSGGGRVVAESLGGRPVARDTDDPLERRLLNVVDEMAIASGTRSPGARVRAMGRESTRAGLRRVRRPSGCHSSYRRRSRAGRLP